MTWPKGNGPGWGGPRRGDGWGGPAKGAGTGGPARGPGRGGDAWRPQPAEPEAEAAAQEMMQKLYDLATQAPDECVQVRAASALLDRLEGKPVARVVTLDPLDR